MKQRQKPKKRNRASVAAVLCFVAAIAVVGTYTFKNYRETQQEEKLAQAEKTEDKTKDKEDIKETSTNAKDIVINTKEKPETETEGEGDEKQEDVAVDPSYGIQTDAVVSNQIYFDSESRLLWPVNGAIIMNYSMDKTVYFSTLDQYKYNPAIVIAGAEGDQVICGAPGVVKSIDVMAETGTTVNIDLGNGYELFYGQLKEVPVKVGDYVEAKTILGYVSQPTKYYSVEGCNVYFEMRKDGQPIDPVTFLE
ncbi:MAG: M23 family metallopeptidase [Lachnospiraceae bacterium]